MRRLSAIILLIPLCILFIGAVNLSSICPSTPQETCRPFAHPCCHAGKEPGGRPGATCPGKQKNDRSACCFDCPLCALITNPAFIRFELTRSETKTEYAVRPDNSLTDYDQHHWKPPDRRSAS